MNTSQSPQQQFNKQSTQLPTYTTIRDPEHPYQMRVSGRYGQKSIPASVFLAQGKSVNQRTAYQLATSLQQQVRHHPQMMSQNLPTVNSNHQHQHLSNQPHHALPLYTYGQQQQQCQPCGQPYTLPVYYQQPMRVRQQWQRPVDSNIQQQQWRFVKTQDKGGVVKYVTRDDDMVETLGGSQWRGYYDQSKRGKALPPVIVPERETKTCCTPVLFALLGLLALIGLLLGLVLLLTSHHEISQPKLVSHSSATYVQPGKVETSQQLAAVPVALQQVISSKPSSVAKPTYTSSITAQSRQTVETQLPITFVSKQQTINTQPVSVSYGYQQSLTNYGQQGYELKDYNNDYQLRPTGETMASYQQTQQPSSSTNTGYQYNNQFQTSSLSTTLSSSVGDNNLNNFNNFGVQQQKKGNYDFRVPEGYKIDENGMITPL